MALVQNNDPRNVGQALSRLAELLPNESWVGALVQRSISMLQLYDTKQIDGNALVFNLRNIKQVSQDHVTYEEALHKNKLDDILNPLIDNLKGA